MEIARLDIVVRSEAAVKASTDVENALTKLGDKAQKTARPMGAAFDKLKNSLFSVKGLVVGLAGGLGVSQLVQYSSTWEDITSRVRLAADETEKVSGVMSRLQQIADRNYSSFESVAETYLRNASTLNALGIETQKQIDLTEAVANAMTVSGAKGQRADTVMQAFARSMAAGALKGDDLNTVIQQGGRLAQALADGLGKPVTSLRQMGQEGELTAAKMEKALGSQLEKLRKEADSMPATIGDAFTRMRNQIMATVGSLSKDSGLNSAFVGIIDKITVAIRDLTPVLLNVARAFTMTLDPSDELSESVKGAISPFIVIFGVLEGGAKLIKTVVVTGFKMLALNIESLIALVLGAGETWDHMMKGMWNAAKAFVQGAVNQFKALGKVVDGITSLDFGKVMEGFSEAASAGRQAFDTAVGSIKGGANAAKTSWSTTMQILTEKNREYNTLMAESSAQALEDVLGTAQKTKDKLDQLWDPSKRKTQDRKEEMGEGNIADTPPTGLVEAAKDAGKAKDAMKELVSELGSLRGQLDGVWAANQELAAGLKTLDAAEKANLITKEQRAILEGQLRKSLEDQLDPMKALNDDMDEQISLLRMSSKEREIENELISRKNELTGAGLVLGEADIAQMRARIAALREENKLSAERDRLKENSLAGRLEEQETTKTAMKGLLADPKAEYREADAARELQSEFGISIGDMQTEAEERLEVLRAYYGALQELRTEDLDFAKEMAEAESAIQKAKVDVMQETLGKIGQVQQLGEVMMMSSNKKVFRAGKALALAGAVVNGISAAMKSFDNGGGYPWGLIPMALSIATTAAQISKIRSQEMPGFRTGGEYLVGGTGGPDSQFVGMNVTPGERISINTPAQAVAAQKLVGLMEKQAMAPQKSFQQSLTIVQQGRPDNNTPEQNARAMRKQAEKMGVV